MLAFFVVMTLTVRGSNAYNWQSGSNGQVMWASGCDFYGNDVGSQASSAPDCGGICVAKSNCDHFTWFNGVCYLKKAVNPPAKDLNGAVCGWVQGGSPPAPPSPSAVSAVATYWSEKTDAGGCQMPGTVNYAVTDALALGQATSLGNLIWRQGLCGQVLKVDCGRGSTVNAVVASTCNLGSATCGVDLIGKTWRTVTSNQSPGTAQCKVSLTNINPMQGSSPLCFYRPSSPTNNAYYASLGVFNTNGRIPSSATLAGVQGQKDSGDSYFTFNSGGSFTSGAAVRFNFGDGSSASFQLSSCSAGGNTHIFQ